MPTCGALALGISPAAQHHAPSGWQPGGPLKPLYQSAVKSIHDHEFDRAEGLCNKGLALAKGDKAFTDLLGQIPQWRHDAFQAQVTAQYAKAVHYVHDGDLDAGERECHSGLNLDPGNNSFIELLRDINGRRNGNLQNEILDIYQRATTLMNRGKYRAALDECHRGLHKQPHDPQLESLVHLIHERQSGDDSR